MRNLLLVTTMFGLMTSNLCAAQGAPPLPKPLPLIGLHAYAEKSVTAGDTIHFRTSSTVPYRLSICRLGQLVDDISGDEVLKILQVDEPLQQPIHPGSYVHVGQTWSADFAFSAMALECWVRPWKLNGWQTLISQHDYPTNCGFALSIDGAGHVQFYAGDGTDYDANWALTGPALDHRQWHHVVGNWDGTTMTLWINGHQVAQQARNGAVKPGTAPLRLGACSHDGQIVNLLDGDIAMPVIYDRALSADEIKARLQTKGLQSPTGKHVVACWPLSEEKGSRIADIAGHRRDGRIVNSATWMIGGPSFDGSEVPRFAAYEPALDHERGHGLRFASDDLYDCGWQTTESYGIPKSAVPGFYVGRYDYELDGTPRVYHVTFVVKKPPQRRKAPILMLAATATWGAYSATSFPANPPGLHHFWPCGGIENSPGNPPAYCMYRDHHAGQPAYKVGLNKPWPNAGPYVLYSDESIGYSHIMRAERFLQVWLEKSGYEYDMIGDLDLHNRPQVLEGYQVLIINGHSEYWSAEAYEAVDRYLCQGGNVLVMSGNSICWRVSFDPTGTIMECRKLGTLPGGRPGCTVGEMWHSHDGRRGSLTRECGYPAWRLVGLATLGFWGGEQNTRYEVQQPDHFLFQEPEPVGLAKGDAFGGAMDGGLPRAVGHEPDVRLSLLRELTTDVPPEAKLPEEPAGIITLADSQQPEAAAFDYYFRPVRLVDGVACHMIYWERPRGGRVFHAGSLGAGWGLSADAKFQTLIRNVLHHFGVTRNP
jgi:hypothetical protein